MLKKINILLENKWFPISFRILTFVCFLGLVIIGFSGHTNDTVFLRQLSKTNLTSIFVWGIWWPMIILSAIIFGRVWCMVCPVEMITTFFAKIGFKCKRPQWILSGWVITSFYAIIVVVGVTIFQIDLNPKYTSLYLLIIIGISIISGLIFEKNTFCRYICPVGYLLGLFSKMAIWGWRVKRKPVCETCKDKSCIKSKYTYQLNYKSCGVDLIPTEINNNNHCLFCAGCLKTCKEYQANNNLLRPNPAIVKIGFANDLLQIKPLLFVEWVFLFFLSGHLIDEITEFRFISDVSALLVPENISTYLNIPKSLAKDIIGSVFLFFFLPLILWILPYILILSVRIRISAINYVKYISQIFLPIIISLFIGLIIMEFATKLPYYKYILHDFTGIETIRAILSKQIVVSRLPYWTQWIFSISLLLSIAGGVFISFKVIRRLALIFKIKQKTPLLYIIPFIFVLVFFAEVLMYRSF